MSYVVGKRVYSEIPKIITINDYSYVGVFKDYDSADKYIALMRADSSTKGLIYEIFSIKEWQKRDN